MSQLIRFLILIFALAAITPNNAGAQSTPPVSMKGWRHAGTDAAGGYIFTCSPPACASPSTVTYSLQPPRQFTFEEHRKGAEATTAQLQKMAPQGTRIQLLGVDNASKQTGNLSLRMYKIRRLITGPDGAKRFMVSGFVLGSHRIANIVSSASDEKTAEQNFVQYAAPLWLIANDKLER